LQGPAQYTVLSRNTRVAIPGQEAGIDDALLGAIENPRERMITLQLEEHILRFIRSKYVASHT
jgi:hypothetical protein